MTRVWWIRALWAVVVLSLVPAAWLAVQRAGVEGTDRTVAVVMDEVALADQGDYLGLDSFELAQRYQALGLTGIALYEQTVETLADEGRAAVLSGAEARAVAAARGDAIPDVAGDTTLITALEEGALEGLLRKSAIPPRELMLQGRTWYVFDGSGQTSLRRPAGPHRAQVEAFAEAGFDLAYRPRNYPGLQAVGEDFPPEADYLIHAGLDVAGHPSGLDPLVEASQDYLTAIIEGTPQDGLARISHAIPTTRLLSFNQDYINLRLRPRDLIDKYLLAVSERNIRLLYLRPYTEEQLGDMVANTEELVAGLAEALTAEGYTIGQIRPDQLAYDPSLLLRALAAVGVIAGLALLGLLFPGVWGVLVAAAVLALGVVAGGADWDALALVAALAFPVLGFGYLPRRGWSIVGATLVSLSGALLLTAVGSDRASLLGIEPFAGVAATLVVPPALFLFHEALRFRRPAAWITSLWSHPVRLGEVALAVVVAGILGLIVMRRGNFPLLSASGLELTVRETLSEWFVRPRFKELLGHPAALLGLVQGTWPAWIRAALLSAGVVAQATILNSFSHYHTPLLVSLQRSVIALVLGVAIGFVLVALARVAVALVRRWLRTA